MQATEHIDFRQYWLAIKRHWLPATSVFGLVVVLTALTTILQKPVYEAKGKLLIKKSNNVTSAMREEDLGQEKLNSVGRQSDPLNTEAEIIRSAPIARRTIATLKLEIKPNKFLPRLKVKQIGATDILEVSYRSPDSKEAAIVVNQIMNLYLENNVLANRTEAAAARQFITEQLPKTEAIVRQAEIILRRFEEENNIVDLEAEAQSAVEVIANLKSQVNEVQAKLADAKTQSEALRKDFLGMNSQEAISASSVSQSPGVQRALEDLQQIESLLAVGRTIYQETHPTLVSLNSKKASLESLLKGRLEQVIGVQNQPNRDLQVGALKQQITADLVRLETGRLGLGSQLSALSNILATYQEQTKGIPKLKQRKRELDREVQAAQSTYETLLRRLEEIRVEENRAVGNARLIEDAQVPELSVASNKLGNLALGNLLGILLAIGTALVLDALNTSIKTVKEAKEVFGYTLLGIIPAFGKSEKSPLHNENSEQSAASKIVVRDTPRSPISETYRMLQANLKFLSSDKELKVIVVTSSVPQEGKSTVSANLAVAMAQSGHKVLLLDADMRLPSQHNIWNLLNQTGLSNVLVGQAQLKTAIKEVMTNLHVLTAGVTPPNPMALLDSKRMASLIEKFSQNYSFVIIDTPSLSIAADAPILGKMADGILLVVQPGLVDSSSAAAAKEFLKQSGQNVLGQVVNGVTSDSNAYNYYYAKEYYAEEDTTSKPVTSDTRTTANRS